MNLEPLGDRVVIEPVDQLEKTTGGVLLPDTAKEKSQEGVVRAVGTGRVTDEGKTLPMTVKVNDRVWFSKYAGSEIKYENKDYVIVSEKDVLVIVSKVPAGVN